VTVITILYLYNNKEDNTGRQYISLAEITKQREKQKEFVANLFTENSSVDAGPTDSMTSSQPLHCDYTNPNTHSMNLYISSISIHQKHLAPTGVLSPG